MNETRETSKYIDVCRYDLVKIIQIASTIVNKSFGGGCALLEALTSLPSGGMGFGKPKVDSWVSLANPRGAGSCRLLARGSGIEFQRPHRIHTGQPPNPRRRVQPAVSSAEPLHTIG